MAATEVETLPQGPIIGIDLGTTNSVVSFVRNGIPEVIREANEALLPSVVGLDPSGQLLIGQSAKNQLVAFPERTIASVKRHMGKMEKLQLGDNQVTPPEVSAMILRRLRDRATTALGQDVRRAVITVPAFFDENQRQATREAGRLAGLHVERIINEPTAATLVYHVDASTRAHLVVYDFGGGTFDVSIVRMEAGVIEVLASSGDTHLGGDDLDLALMDYIAARFDRDHGLDLRKQASSRWRLLQACEAAKKVLSVEEEVRIVEEFIAEKNGQAVNLDIKITRDEFEKLISPFVEKTIDCVDHALRDSGLALSQIADLLLVGGSTRIPLVEERLRQEYKLEPSRTVDPDLAVALGAGVQAAMIAGQSVGKVLVDVTTHTLGIEVMEFDASGRERLVCSPIIHRNTPLPVSHEKAYYALYDEQTGAQIDVYQGESEKVEHNRLIGGFLLKLDRPEKSRDKVVVRFDLSLDGTLKVTAMQKAADHKETLTINNALSQFREEESADAMQRINSMFENAAAPGDIFKFDPGNMTTQWEVHLGEEMPGLSTQAKEEFKDAIATYNNAVRGLTKMTGDDAEDMIELVKQLELALHSEDRDAIAELCSEIDDVLFYAES